MVTPFRQRSGAMLTLLVAASTTVVGGCSVSTNKKVAVSQAAPTSMDATAAARVQALAAYNGMIEDWVTVSRTGDYQNPILSQHASGAALTLVAQAVYLEKAHGYTSKGHPSGNPSVQKLTPPDDPTEAVVIDCADGRAWQRVDANGVALPDPGSTRHHVEVTVDKIGNTWKVTKYLLQKAGSC